jgi:uncharacterized protein YcfJ
MRDSSATYRRRMTFPIRSRSSAMKLNSVAAAAVSSAAALVPLSAHATEVARVISATPVTAAVAVSNRVCTEEQQLIGAIAGGVLGNNIGGGFGRAAATGIGAVAGATIGNGIEVNAANAYPPTAVPVQRCQTVNGYENRTVGYDVVYEYAGRRYTTRMARDPGPSLEIDIRPAGALANAATAAPQYLDAPPPRAIYAPMPVPAAPPVIYVTPSVGYYGGYYGPPRHHRWY